MKNMVILGAGCGGTMMANKMRKHLDRREWKITLIDKDNIHDYQPGYLFVPFGINTEKEIRKTKREFIKPGIDFVISEVVNVDWDLQEVATATQGKFRYDILIMSTGCDVYPEEVEGLAETWGKDVYGFYRYDDCIELKKALSKFEGGRFVISIAEMPIKCPVAPIEFAFLLDWYFREQGMREKVEIEYVTPLTGAFTKPVATKILTEAFEKKGIRITPNFALGSVDGERKVLQSYDGTEVGYDMLVSIPPNFGSKVMIDSGIADPMGYIPVDKYTLQPKDRDNVWVLGDGTNAPTSKAGAVTHFQSDILEENILAFIEGRPQHGRSDGHATCFIESGFGKAYLIDFNYDVEPVVGEYPFPAVGPLGLLKDNEINHISKLLFKWAYYNLLLAGTWLGPPALNLSGKRLDMIRKK